MLGRWKNRYFGALDQIAMLSGRLGRTQLELIECRRQIADLEARHQRDMQAVSDLGRKCGVQQAQLNGLVEKESMLEARLIVVVKERDRMRDRVFIATQALGESERRLAALCGIGERVAANWALIPSLRAEIGRAGRFIDGLCHTIHMLRRI